MKLELHYADDWAAGGHGWAALYVDGWLATVGDAYIAEEKAFSLLGVTVVHDDAFMRGQAERSGVAPNLPDVAAYAAGREERKKEAARLRKEAAKLLAEAAAVEGERG